MTVYHTLEGGLETAQLSLQRLGGQLFPARDAEGPFIHVCGSNIYTFWPRASKRRGYTIELAKTFGFDPEIATTSRIVRYLIDDVLGSPHKDTFFCEKWRGLAKDGSHWHYLHCNPGRYEYAIEIDLKSAYWTAFANAPSMLLNQHKEWIDDNGALDSLRVLIPTTPKPFRLALLGSLASWRHTYWTKDKEDPTGFGIKSRQKHEVKYGAAFNAAHCAILKVYRIMKRLHEIAGEDCLRIHTDGIILNCRNGMKWEQEIDDFLGEKGFDYTTKGNGDTWLIDVNTGVIGRKVMGCRRIVVDAAKEAGIKINLNAPAPEMKVFKLSELPATVGAEVGVNPTGIDTQTALPFLLENSP